MHSPSSELARVPWRDRPITPLSDFPRIAGLSRAVAYSLEKEGRLAFKRLGGRTFIDTASLARLLDSAEPWTPSAKTKRACEVRKMREAFHD